MSPPGAGALDTADSDRARLRLRSEELDKEAFVRVIRSFSVAVVFLAGAVQTAIAEQPPAPPTSEEAQAAYSRFLTAFVGRLIGAGLPATLSPGKYAEINEFAHRQRLRGCDDWREPDVDAFAPTGSTPPPIQFNCTWESGERISLTKVPNTGSWMVSDDKAAAAGAGMLLSGPMQEAPQVVGVPTAPIKPPAAEEAPPPAAPASPPPPSVYTGPNLQAMPSPYVPPAGAPAVQRTERSPANAGPMPTPFGGANR